VEKRRKSCKQLRASSRGDPVVRIPRSLPKTVQDRWRLLRVAVPVAAFTPVGFVSLEFLTKYFCSSGRFLPVSTGFNFDRREVSKNWANRRVDGRMVGGVRGLVSESRKGH